MDEQMKLLIERLSAAVDRLEQRVRALEDKEDTVVDDPIFDLTKEI